MGEKSEIKIFPETHVYCELKTMKKNYLEKVRKHVFYKHMKIVTKNGGKKREKKFFPETHVYREKKTMEKIVRKKFENKFFINTGIS